MVEGYPGPDNTAATCEPSMVNVITVSACCNGDICLVAAWVCYKSEGGKYGNRGKSLQAPSEANQMALSLQTLSAFFLRSGPGLPGRASDARPLDGRPPPRAGSVGTKGTLGLAASTPSSLRNLRLGMKE